jgi:hypothetical protein
MSHSIQIVIACEDPARLAEFWAPALGYVPEPPPEGFDTWEEFADAIGIPEGNRNDLGSVIDPEGHGPRLLFERYDAGPHSQRVHLDVNVVGHAEVTEEERRALLAGERARLEALGGSFKREATGLAGEYWIEMFDPEGNWFCVQ